MTTFMIGVFGKRTTLHNIVSVSNIIIVQLTEITIQHASSYVMLHCFQKERRKSNCCAQLIFENYYGYLLG